MRAPRALLLLFVLSTAAIQRALATYPIGNTPVKAVFSWNSPLPTPPIRNLFLQGAAVPLGSCSAGTPCNAASYGWSSANGDIQTVPVSGLTFIKADNSPGPGLVQLAPDNNGIIDLRVAGLSPSLTSTTPPLTSAVLTLESLTLPGFDGLTITATNPCSGVTLNGIINGKITWTVSPGASCGGGSQYELGPPVCFPAASTLRRLTGRPSAAAAPEEAWETVAMPDLRVGDTVDCLTRDPVFGRNNVTSAAYGRRGRCTVWGYKKAQPATAAPYTRITFDDEPTLADAPPAPGAVTMSANHHLLDPLTGQARQAGSLRPGDAVLRATPSGALVPARVQSVASVREGGAYVPLLSGGGLPIVDGVVAYPSSGDSDVGLDAKHWGQHYLHAPVWQPLLASDDDGHKAPLTGRTLAELGAQAPVAAFTQKWHAVRAAAAREGRTFCDWAGVAAEMHASITGQGKVYSEAEALAVLNKHHRKVTPRGVAEV